MLDVSVQTMSRFSKYHEGNSPGGEGCLVCGLRGKSLLGCWEVGEGVLYNYEVRNGIMSSSHKL
jgi:hypothetical protein